ncbi:MAG: FAD/NAD(P)-binding protein [Candidatus Eisenbacteria bacterium]
MSEVQYVRHAEYNPFYPEMMRIVRTHVLTDDVKMFQVRPTSRKTALSVEYLPGQFMMVSVIGVGEAPFSISSSPSRPGLLEFCIRQAGSLTNSLFTLKENSLIGVRGPYGNGFPIQKMVGRDLIIVVGGLGAAPLRSLLLYVLDNRDMFGKVSFLCGAKKPAEMLFREEFLSLRPREDINVLLAVDADDIGKWPEHVGLVTCLFDHVKDVDPENTYAVVCGPPVMYKFVIKELLKYDIPKNQILMTLERRMKCGTGKCGHCAIDYIYTCLDGPVFSYWDVLHMRELI